MSTSIIKAITNYLILVHFHDKHVTDIATTFRLEPSIQYGSVSRCFCESKASTGRGNISCDGWGQPLTYGGINEV